MASIDRIMPMLFGFIDASHQAAFESARDQHRRGGGLAKCCGAKTRNGGSCMLPPLEGQTRCLRHAGPNGARRYRDRQLQELAAGHLDPAVFAKAERRRAVNRLKYLWKKNPWVPGATIDLGIHEKA